MLSTVQMPPGVPVACVAIDGGANAAWLAARILAVEDDELSARLEAEAQDMARKVEGKNDAIRAKYNQH